jgi:hypothetical protein
MVLHWPGSEGALGVGVFACLSGSQEPCWRSRMTSLAPASPMLGFRALCARSITTSQSVSSGSLDETLVTLHYLPEIRKGLAV